jgi:hypothetical protein
VILEHIEKLGVNGGVVLRVGVGQKQGGIFGKVVSELG